MVKITGAKPKASTSFSTTDEIFKITKKSKIAESNTEFANNPQISSFLETASEELFADKDEVVDVTAEVISNNHQTQLIFKQG